MGDMQEPGTIQFVADTHIRHEMTYKGKITTYGKNVTFINLYGMA